MQSLTCEILVTSSFVYLLIFIIYLNLFILFNIYLFIFILFSYFTFLNKL